MSLLTPEELARLAPAETHAFPAPVPTQIVSSDEFAPIAQTPRQRAVERRLKDMGRELAAHQGLSRRRFFQSAAGMAAAFVAMNDVFGPIFDASPAEAASPDLAQARASALADQFVMDVHTHFLRDDTRLTGFVEMRKAVGKEQSLDDLKYESWLKEVFLDSDTKVALISGAPSKDPRDWFLTNEMKAAARAKVNA